MLTRIVSEPWIQSRPWIKDRAKLASESMPRNLANCSSHSQASRPISSLLKYMKSDQRAMDFREMSGFDKPEATGKKRPLP